MKKVYVLHAPESDSKKLTNSHLATVECGLPNNGDCSMLQNLYVSIKSMSGSV